jgi:succinate dehydrogenase / fumarate reductase iron-sulfur subunit
MRLTFTIARYNPERDTHPHSEDYRLEIGRNLTVLEALIRLKQEQDGSLTFRYSCRSAICGSCAMTINGCEKLACRTSVKTELHRHGQIMVAPLRNLPVIKDLVVDMSSFWSKLRDVTPWLIPGAGSACALGTPALRLLPDGDRFHNVDACILCGACVGACASHAVSRNFLGPAALAKADRFLSDPRESPHAKRARLRTLEQPDGIWDCTRCNLCVEVCPKDVRPMEAIIRLRRAALDAGLTATGGARHITGFCRLIEEEGRLNEARMPLKIIGLDLARAWRILPLGFRMWWRGKVPNPLEAPIGEMTPIRLLFASFRRRRADRKEPA